MFLGCSDCVGLEGRESRGLFLLNIVSDMGQWAYAEFNADVEWSALIVIEQDLDKLYTEKANA